MDEAQPNPTRRSWLAVWHWPWWVWALLAPVAFTAYGFSSGVVFYALHVCNITDGPVYDVFATLYWPVSWLRFNLSFGNAIGRWWWETLCWLFGKPAD